MTKKIGVLGLGYMGMIHAKNLIAMGHKVYGWDPSLAKSRALVEAGGGEMDDPIPYSFETIGACDGVVVASPMHMHLAHADRAVGRNKVVLIEKPISDCTDTSYLEEILASATKPIMVGNNGRYHPCLKIAKRHIPKLGKIKRAVFAISQHKDEPRDDIFLNWGAHGVDFALYLLGAAILKCSLKRAEGAVGTLILQHDGGYDSVVYLDYIGAQDTRYFVIEGENGNIWADLDRFIIKIRDSDGMELSSLNGSWDDTYKEEMREFIRRIDGEEPDGIGATGDEGLACLKILLEAQKNSEESK